MGGNIQICTRHTQCFNMDRILLVFACSAVLGCASALNCTTMPDGIYEQGCRSYSQCVGKVKSTIDCPEHQVYNNATSSCDDPANVLPPCGEMIDCTGKADAGYPDLNRKCTTWYTCLDEKFLGHNFCPSGTVFDSTLGTCNWSKQVASPCGTFT